MYSKFWAGVYWRAVYKDGTVLLQTTKEGKKNKYADIDRDKLKYFDLLDGNKLLFRLHLEPGRRLICRRRTIGDVFDASKKRVVWLIGWQWTVNGRNVQDIAWVYENGVVELTGRFKECPYDMPKSFVKGEEVKKDG